MASKFVVLFDTLYQKVNLAKFISMSLVKDYGVNVNHTVRVVDLTDNIKLEISRASVEDAQAIIHFLNKVGGETDFLTFGENEFPFSLADEQTIIAECLELNFCLMLVGKIGDHIVSQLFLSRSCKPRLAHIGDVGISVSKQYWGKSIGRHMMLAAIEWARCNSVTKLQLQVRTDNERAVQLYKKMGFAIEGTIARAMQINNRYFDDYVMGLQL